MKLLESKEKTSLYSDKNNWNYKQYFCCSCLRNESCKIGLNKSCQIVNFLIKKHLFYDFSISGDNLQYIQTF